MNVEERKTRALEYVEIALKISLEEFRSPEVKKHQQNLALMEVQEVLELEEREKRDAG